MLMASDHRRLAVAEIADGLRVLEAEEAVLERLQIDELLEQLAGLLEGLAGKAAVLAPQRRIEGRLAADAHRKMRPVEMQRPFVGAADHDRRDAGRLQRLHRGEQIVPGLDLGRIDIGLGHQILVVEEADLRQRDRQAIDAGRSA